MIIIEKSVIIIEKIILTIEKDVHPIDELQFKKNNSI